MEGVNSQLSALNRNILNISEKLENVNRKVNNFEGDFAKIERHITAIDEKIEVIDKRVTTMESRERGRGETGIVWSDINERLLVFEKSKDLNDKRIACLENSMKPRGSACPLTDQESSPSLASHMNAGYDHEHGDVIALIEINRTPAQEGKKFIGYIACKVKYPT